MKNESYRTHLQFARFHIRTMMRALPLPLRRHHRPLVLVRRVMDLLLTQKLARQLRLLRPALHLALHPVRVLGVTLLPQPLELRRLLGRVRDSVFVRLPAPTAGGG